MKLGDEWRKVPPTVAGSKEVGNSVDPDSPLFFALRVVCGHIKEGKKRVAGKVCTSVLKGSKEKGVELLKAAGVLRDGEDWKVSGGKDRECSSPLGVPSYTTNNVTYDLAECVHVGKTVSIRAYRKAAGKDTEEVLIRLHCHTPQYYFNEISSLLALTGHSFVCRLFEVTCLGGIPGTVVSYVKGTPLSRMEPLEDPNTLLLLIESLLNAFNELEMSSLCNWNLTPDNVLFTKARGVTLLRMGETRTYSRVERPSVPLNGSRSSIRSLTNDVAEDEGWACNTYALRSCLARVKELSAGIATNARSAATLFVSAVESASGAPLQHATMQPMPTGNKFTVSDIICIWNKFKWERRSGNSSPTSNASGTSNHGAASPNRISKRISAMQQEASSQEADAERMRELRLLKERRKSAPRAAAQEETTNDDWLAKQAAEEERRRLAFLKEIEEQEKAQGKERKAERRRSSKVSKEVEELRTVLKKHRTSVDKGDSELDGEQATEDWTAKQLAVESKRRYAFLQEIEAKETLAAARKKMKDEGKVVKQAEAENIDSFENFLVKQAKEEEKRRQQFIEEIEARDQLKTVLKKSAGKKRYSDDHGSPRDSSSSEWMQQQQLEEQRRRKAFLKEIETTEKGQSSRPPLPSKRSSKESAEISAMRETVKKNRRESYTRADIEQTLDSGPEEESQWVRNQRLEEEKRRAAFLKEIEQGSSK